MTKTTSMTRIEQMEARRRELDRQIRAAKREADRAAKKAVEDARHALGEELALATGADTVELIERLRTVLMSGQTLVGIRRAIGTEAPGPPSAETTNEDGDLDEQHDAA
ncbi:hypothetical protein I8D64_11635 [Brachybacterium sp. MASK1Z-5]|uniref:Uncharacterized protein n=1 Tax=Brachybacterium halotolerans TaxID=2795215 RepID=A0ABS1BDH0_9MICO|nr:hypothetical protein [Brachybacterium halotolerans]MBK0332050.1 hypothetical protein [Brachybacterium halotolerans]